MITRGFRRRRTEDDGRLPPGQYLEYDFPVLSAGPTPLTSLDLHVAVDQASAGAPAPRTAKPLPATAAKPPRRSRAVSREQWMWIGIAAVTALIGIVIGVLIGSA
jgi:hypothetical protein